jgi:integrase/recombinase XerD
MDSYFKKFILFIRFDLRLSTNTVLSYENDLQKYLSFLKNIKNINDIKLITYDHIRSYIAYLSKENQKPSSINRNISSIKKFHLYLFDNELTLNNPSELLESQKNIRNLPDTLSVQEIEIILGSVKTDTNIGVRDLAILSLLYSSGIRVSELINLEFSNIFLDEEYIKILGKGKKERLVPIGLKAKVNLINYIKKHRKSTLPISSKGYIFLSYRSKPMTRMAIFNLIKKYSTIGGIRKKVSPHTFRHSFATHMLEGGADLRIVQEILGHENINTTEIYTHLDRTYLKEVHKLCHPRG